MKKQRKWGKPPRRVVRGGDVPAFGSADPHTVAIQPKAAAPESSWWLGAQTREEFRQKAQAELPRIQGTGFGKRDKLITSSSGVAQ